MNENHARFMVAAQLTRETPSSIEIATTAWGGTTYAIKCYAEVGKEYEALDLALLLDGRMRHALGLEQRPPIAAALEFEARIRGAPS